MGFFVEDTESESEDNLSQLPLKERLEIAKYKAQDCEDAIHGSRIPEALASRPIGCALFAAYSIMHAP